MGLVLPRQPSPAQSCFPQTSTTLQNKCNAWASLKSLVGFFCLFFFEPGEFTFPSFSLQPVSRVYFFFNKKEESRALHVTSASLSRAAASGTGQAVEKRLKQLAGLGPGRAFCSLPSSFPCQNLHPSHISNHSNMYWRESIL